MHRNPIESLEGRQYFAVTAVFNPAGGGSLTVVGDAGHNAITVSRTAAGHLKVNNGAVPIAGGTPTVNNVAQINMTGGDGNDVLKLDEANGTLPAATITGGNGHDTMTGGSLADTFIGGSGNDTATGGKGNDVAVMGEGDDTFVWFPGDGSDSIEGGGGTDTMKFFGSGGDEKFAVLPNGNRLRFTRDLGNIVMDANDLEKVDLIALGGKDEVVVANLAGTDVRHVAIDLGNDGADDKVIVNGTANADNISVTGANGEVTVSGLWATTKIKGAQPTDHLTVKANAGHDTVSALTLATPIKLAIDGGDGNDKLTGSNLADEFRAGAGNDNVIGARGNDKAWLDAGDDVFVWFPGDGSDSMDGGAGTDTMKFFGSDGDERFEALNNGGRLKFTRDLGNIVMDGASIEKVDLLALGGADTVTVHNLAGTATRQVKVDLGKQGGGVDGSVDSVTVGGTFGNDLITVGTSGGNVRVAGLWTEVLIANAKPAADKLTVLGLSGHDKIDATALPAGYIKYRVEGGAGNDKLYGSQGADEMFGQDGDDELYGNAGDDLLNGGNGWDKLTGGPGADTLVNGEVNVQ